jgi:hypothetical protein
MSDLLVRPLLASAGASIFAILFDNMSFPFKLSFNCPKQEEEGRTALLSGTQKDCAVLREAAMLNKLQTFFFMSGYNI